ncbi:hypothetical protein PVAP13_1NG132100 [Panicum virgatum]|uniref:Uncharacterized protein n=1 Tax=Panicum virgatum TaxID=38727 RepID=A0A8T0WXZ6_PANVG|nr:hypothetical protein PVAP13_1NG419838 [Panicum virgatum]KAG2649783.1 hypothetical protein PVAP13_1NG132100 [Panicum virgatum]
MGPSLNSLPTIHRLLLQSCGSCHSTSLSGQRNVPRPSLRSTNHADPRASARPTAAAAARRNLYDRWSRWPPSLMPRRVPSGRRRRGRMSCWSPAPAPATSTRWPRF